MLMLYSRHASQVATKSSGKLSHSNQWNQVIFLDVCSALKKCIFFNRELENIIPDIGPGHSCFTDIDVSPEPRTVPDPVFPKVKRKHYARFRIR